MRSQIFNRTKSQKGQSLAEFALLMPVFVFILFGIVEFGRMWETANVVTGAARAGVRVAAVTNPDVAQAQNAARSVLNAANLGWANVNVMGPNGSNEVTVTVSMTYTPITGSLVPGVGSISISRSSVMRWEG